MRFLFSDDDGEFKEFGEEMKVVYLLVKVVKIL